MNNNLDIVLSKNGWMRYKATKGRFGVEIETEGRNLPPAVFGWDVHKEGSLRGEANEYVTHGAVTRDELEHLMDMMALSFKDNMTKVDEDSYRASTHIHVNVQDLTYRQIMGSITCFLMVEPLLLRMCGPNRDGNLFCLPSYDCGDMPEYFEGIVESVMRNGHHAGVRERGKYASLNTNPLSTFGTLEFRVFPCSVQKATILQWADVCHNIVNTGAGMVSLGREVDDFYRNPAKLCNKVFGEWLDQQQLDHFDLDNLIEVGAESAFAAVRAYQFALRKHEKKLAA